MRGKFSAIAHDINFRTGTFAADSTNSGAGYTENLDDTVWEQSNVSSCLVYCVGPTAGDMCTILAKVNF